MKSIIRTISILAFFIAVLIPTFPTQAAGVPCTWKVNDGTWGVKENWDCGKVPEPEDDIYISSGQVTLTGNVSVKSLTLSGNGALTGTGDVVAGTVTWTGGTMSGSGSITATTEAHFTGSNYLTLSGRSFINAGTATLNWPGSTGFLYLYAADSEFHNLAGATFTIQSANVLKVVGGSGKFINEGRFIMDIPEDTVQIGATFVNTSPGVVEVASGTLMINNTIATTNTGSYNILAGATLSLGGVAQSLAGSIAGTGSGTLEIVTGVTLDGTFTFPGGILSLSANGVVNLSTAATTASVGTLNLSGGVLTGPGNLTAGTVNWSAGTMSGTGSTTATNALNFTGSAVLTLNNRTLNNAGAATWNRTSYMDTQGTAGTLNNQAGATFIIQNSPLNFLVGGGTFNNAGTLTKSGPITDVKISTSFVNTGIVEVEAGQLLTNNSSAAIPASSGDYHIHSGATLRLGGNVFAMTGSIAVTGPGTVETSADIILDGTLSFPDGALTLISGGMLNVSTETTTANIGILNLSLGTVEGPGDVTAGTLNWSAGTMSGTGSTTASSAANFTGTGTITLSERTFNNAGTATWSRTGAGNLYFSTESTVFNNQAGATFTVQPTGQAVIFVGSGVINNAGTLNLTTGEFRIHTFTQSSGGKTNLAISGVTPFTNYSRFVTNHLALAGELNVTFTGGYTPQFGDRYVLVTYSSDRSGDYSPAKVTPVGDIIWERYYQGNALNLWAVKCRVYIPTVLRP